MKKMGNAKAPARARSSTGECIFDEKIANSYSVYLEK